MRFLLADLADGVQYVHFLIPDLVGVEGDGRLHVNHAHELEDMVLYHVTQRARELS